MLTVMILILVLPLAATVSCIWAPQRLCGLITAVTGLSCLGLVTAVAVTAAHRDLGYAGVLRADALSAVFLLATGFLYAAVAVYSVGYLAHGGSGPGHARYSRRFWPGLNIFAWAMLAAPLLNSLALLWIAIEVTTVISALLVAIEDTDGAAEAAWKYVLIASAGLGLALLATVFAYYAGAQVLAEHYNLAIQPLIAAGAKLPATPVRLAFLLALLGYGTKVGLFPVHTWLPDAHSEAPTPVSALLSGSLLAISFYAILRFYQVAAASLGSGFPRYALLAVGVASLLLASLYVFGQRDIKRLLAYSSVEHMGILAMGMSFGAAAALGGVLLHVLAHAAAKGSAFMGAGVFAVKFGTKRIASVRGGLAVLPWSGPLFLLAIFGLSALPPSGLFRSEFQIVAGGFGGGSYAAAAVLIVLVTIAFFGLATSATSMLLTPAPDIAITGPAETAVPVREAAAATDGSRAAARAGVAVRPRAAQGARGARVVPRGEPSAWMVVPVLAGMAVLFLLGLHPPGEVMDLIGRGVAQLGGTP
jgi:hydrogenase-4 component F